MPSVAKRGDSFRIMASLGYGMDGRQIRKTCTFKPPENVTPAKAEKLAIAYAHEFERRCRGLTNLGEHMRFCELSEWYYTEIAPSVIKPVTIYNQKQLLNSYIPPELGHLKLKDISTARLDEFINRLVRDGGMLAGYALTNKAIIPLGQRAPFARKAGVSAGLITNLAQGKCVRLSTAEKVAAALDMQLKEAFHLAYEKKGLSPSTTENVLGVISAIFRIAVKKGICEKNPVLNTTPPKRVKYSEKPFFDDNQCRQLLVALEEHPDRQFALIVKTFLYTGLRSGELCALHWSELDLNEGTITVRHTLTRLNHEYSLSTPKTKSSGRVVNIPQELTDALKAHRDRQSEIGQMFGTEWKWVGQVFTSQSGDYHCRSLVNAKFQRFLQQHGFPRCRTHDLRHANASLLINAGVPAKIIAEHLGHSSTRTTEDVYAHVFAASKAKMAETIISVLKNEFADEK